MQHETTTDRAFYVNDGMRITSLFSLFRAIEKMNHHTFVYHVNVHENKNDFADWIRTTLHNPELAHSLEYITDKDEYLEILQTYLSI